jgi:aminopeptidase N
MSSKFNIIFLSIVFVFIITSALQSQSNILPLCKSAGNYTLNLNTKLNPEFEKYDVKHYKIYLDIDPDLRTLEGLISIRFEALQNNISDLIINLNGLQIDSIIQRNNSLNFNRQQNELLITLDHPVQIRNLDSISIFYHGTPSRGMYFRDGRYGNRVVYTHNEPFDAQYWIPCKDDPSDKALMDIWITVPQNFIAASNGFLLETLQVGQNEKRYHWRESYPISTYLISVAASEYDIVSDVFNWNLYELPLQYYIYPEDYSRGESAITNTIEMLNFFSDYIGDYPFIDEKYAMVEAPFQEAGAMENQTLTTMDEPIIDNESVIAHELAHQWWGDAVTLSSFADIWLNEGFATYFDALFVEHKYGEKAFHERMVSSGSNASSNASVDYAIYNPPIEYLFGNAVYHKGAWVLHMLRNDVGKDVFKTIMRNYYSEYKYRNVSTSEFITLCENISGKNLYKFFDQWVYTSGIPNIFASWKQENNIVHIQLDQLQNETVYDIDFEIKLIGITSDTTFTVNLSSHNQEYIVQFFEPVSQLLVDPEFKVLNTNNSPVYSIPKTTELIRLYPNPFNNELNIFYRVDKFQNIKIELWDVLGKKILTLQNKKKPIGTHRLSYQATGIASGTYFCVLKSDSNIDKRKVILIK